MTTRKRALTAQIKPDTRNAIMDQLAAAADRIIELERVIATTKFLAGWDRPPQNLRNPIPPMNPIQRIRAWWRQ